VCAEAFTKLIVLGAPLLLPRTPAYTRQDDPPLPLSDAPGMYNKERIDPRKQTGVGVSPQRLTGDTFLSKRHTKMQ
jgi:hypothetical protein